MAKRMSATKFTLILLFITHRIAQLKKFSPLRQSLARLSNEIRHIVEPFFSDKPVIKGSVYELSPKVRCYQELRGARARLVEVHKKILKVMDEMEAMRREELPVSRKKPPTQ